MRECQASLIAVSHFGINISPVPFGHGSPVPAPRESTRRRTSGNQPLPFSNRSASLSHLAFFFSVI